MDSDTTDGSLEASHVAEVESSQAPPEVTSPAEVDPESLSSPAPLPEGTNGHSPSENTGDQRKARVNEIIAQAMARRTAKLPPPRRGQWSDANHLTPDDQAASPATQAAAEAQAAPGEDEAAPPAAPTAIAPTVTAAPTATAQTVTTASATATATAPSPPTSGTRPSVTLPASQRMPPAPRARPVVLVASNRFEARYLRHAGTELDLLVTGPCAIEVRMDGADGDLLYEATMDAGDSVELPSRGAVWLRLGNPHAATIEANGKALLLATPAGPTPYNLLFEFAQS